MKFKHLSPLILVTALFNIDCGHKPSRDFHLEFRGIDWKKEGFDGLVCNFELFCKSQYDLRTPQIGMKYLEQRYWHAVSFVEDLKYTEEDLERFLIKYAPAYKMDEDKWPLGVYISALINQISKKGDEFIFPGNLILPNIGYKAKDISIKVIEMGNHFMQFSKNCFVSARAVGDYCAYGAENIILTTDDAGNKLAEESKNSHFRIKEAGNFCGYKSEGLNIEVFRAGDDFMCSSKNAIIKAVNAGNNCGGAADNLNVEVENAGNDFLLWSSNSKAKVKKAGNFCGANSVNLEIEVENAGNYFMLHSKDGKIKTKNQKLIEDWIDNRKE